MNVFTEVYDKSRDLLKVTCFDQRWSNIEPRIKALLADGGFNEAEAEVLQLIRKTLRDAVKDKPQSPKALAEEILALSRPTVTGFQDRAALLKTLQHIYRLSRKGAQAVWIVDHPRSYDKWAYDEVNGLSQEEMKITLAPQREAFGAGNRAVFIPALRLAEKITLDACVRLPKKEAATLAKVRKWFHSGAVADADLDKTVDTLLDGYKQISALCNSNTIIFSDRPHVRTDPAKSNTKASVNKADKMPVIYVFRKFLDYGAADVDGVRSLLWQCSKTIIHELAHKLLSAKDHAYGTKGSRPGASVTDAQAITNADSWGIFALDLAGYLPPATARKAYR